MKHGVVVLAAVAALNLQAQGVMIINGSSKLQGGKLKTTTVSSIIGKDVAPEKMEGGRAIVEPESGKAMEIPCDVSVLPGENSQAELAVWHVAIPANTSIKNLKIMRFDRVVAVVNSSKETAPTLECVESRSDDGVTLLWVLKRPKRFDGSSIWVRWSKDGGTTWQPNGKFLAGDLLNGEVEFLTAEVGDTSGMLVEFWIPEDLKVTVVRHRISKNPS